jgi:hypothetical protein
VDSGNDDVIEIPMPLSLNDLPDEDGAIVGINVRHSSRQAIDVCPRYNG